MYQIGYIFLFKLTCLVQNENEHIQFKQISSKHPTCILYTTVQLRYSLDSLQVAGSYHGSEYQLILCTELFIFTSRCRFPELMTNQLLRHRYKIGIYVSKIILQQIPVALYRNRDFSSRHRCRKKALYLIEIIKLWYFKKIQTNSNHSNIFYFTGTWKQQWFPP